MQYINYDTKIILFNLYLFIIIINVCNNVDIILILAEFNFQNEVALNWYH